MSTSLEELEQLQALYARQAEQLLKGFYLAKYSGADSSLLTSIISEIEGQLLLAALAAKRVARKERELFAYDRALLEALRRERGCNGCTFFLC